MSEPLNLHALTVKQLKAELDRLGVGYPKNALKALLQQMLSDAVADSREGATLDDDNDAELVRPEGCWLPSWLVKGGDPARPPSGLGPGSLVRLSAPIEGDLPPHGGRWVRWPAVPSWAASARRSG